MCALAALGPAAAGLSNGVGRTPIQGWSSWNALRCGISEQVIKEVAAAMVQSGLRDAGYTYVNLDDCWQDARGADGHIVPSPHFPSGIKHLADHLHSLGLKLGLYSDTGNVTCEGKPGSYGREREDASDYAAWGVDLLKYDYCGMDNATLPTSVYYQRMHTALQATGRPMVFSICSWGVGEPHKWGASIGHSWRTSTDLFAVWSEADARELRLPPLFGNVLDAVDRQAELAQHAGPGGYNDLDMLLVGLPGMSPYGYVESPERCPPHLNSKWCKPGQAVTREMWGLVGGLSATEQRAHFSLWCVLASPLVLGNDPRHMSAATLRIVTAPELIRINQDPLGQQARLIWSVGAAQIWRKDLAEAGTHALLMLNRGNRTIDITARWERDIPEASKLWARSVAREPRCFDEHETKFCAYTARTTNRCDEERDFMLKCLRTCKACPPAQWDRGKQATARVRDAWERETLGDFTAQFVARLVEPREARVYVVRFGVPSAKQHGASRRATARGARLAAAGGGSRSARRVT
eukprot:Transcript_28209.p1 GENE.Transcript_28209~~Transcript_28209.p1  ORF type:complete len:537 (-),score=125.79 Transcript_28209:40-1608(-)